MRMSLPDKTILGGAVTLSKLSWFVSDLIGLGPKKALHRYRAYEAIEKSKAFDANFYSRQLGVSGQRQPNLLRHYITTGYLNSLDPSEAFSTEKYLNFYPDVRLNDSDPFSHYLRHGEAEFRISLPSLHAPLTKRSVRSFPVEDAEQYAWPLRDYPDAQAARLQANERRADDEVQLEAKAGESFLSRFSLLSANPDFAGAIAELNALASETSIGKLGDAQPEFSVIIPVFGQLAYTLNCLHSLVLHKTKHSFEICIGDDASPDSTKEWLSGLDWIHFEHREVNQGFIGNSNLTAKLASGDVLIMLNNDTRVVSGWLDGLAESFKQFTRAGLIGSKIFYPDGALQEAGGIIWRDGSAWNYGRGDDPNRPRYCYAREVDYISGCSIAIRSEIWNELAGFDPFFAPAYYEDVDLCMRLRERNYEIWFQPQSRIIHYEGKTSGTDTGEGVKAYQVRNQEKFHERWRERLAHHRSNGQAPWFERERKISQRVLIIDAVNPTPWLDAGSQAVVSLCQYYLALGFGVSFVAENFLFERRAVSELQAIGVQVFYAPYETFLPGLLNKYGPVTDFVHVIRADVAYKCIDLVRSLAPAAKAIFQNCDLHYLRMQRQAEVEHKSDLIVAANEMKARELQLTRDYDLTVSHSYAEKALLEEELTGEEVVVLPLVQDVIFSQTAFSERVDFTFLGGFGHPPNVDAVMWILAEIWPRLAERFEHARLLILGANPPDEIRQHASERILIPGFVEDLTPWFETSRVFLAALRYGAGSKGKVLNSLAHGVPVVATDIAAEGLPLEDGKSIFMANSKEEIVAAAARVYQMRQADWERHSHLAQAYIERHHSFSAGVEVLAGALDKAGRKHEKLFAGAPLKNDSPPEQSALA